MQFHGLETNFNYHTRPPIQIRQCRIKNEYRNPRWKWEKQCVEQVGFLDGPAHGAQVHTLFPGKKETAYRRGNSQEESRPKKGPTHPLTAAARSPPPHARLSSWAALPRWPPRRLSRWGQMRMLIAKRKIADSVPNYHLNSISSTMRTVVLVLTLSQPDQFRPWITKNGHFGSQTFASGSNSSMIDSQILFLPFSYPHLANQSCRSSSLRWSRGLAPPSPSAPMPHLWSASAAAAPADVGGGADVVDLAGQQAVRLEGPAFAETIATVRSTGSSGFHNSQKQATHRGRRGVRRVFGYKLGTHLSRMRKFEDQNDHFRSSETKMSQMRKIKDQNDRFRSLETQLNFEW
jgi:hypothetical protein